MAGLLSGPLRDRFGLVYHMSYYSPEELKTIVLRSARILNVPIQDEGAVLRAARAIFGEGRMRQLRERLFPLPTKVSDSAVVRRLMESGVLNLIRRGSRVLWQLRVWECVAPSLTH